MLRLRRRSFFPLVSVAATALALGTTGCTSASSSDGVLFTEEWRGALPQTSSPDTFVAYGNGGFIASGLANPAVNSQGFITAIDAQGVPQWTSAVDPAADLAFAAAADGSVYLLATIFEDTSLLGSTVKASAYPAKFLAKFAPETGKPAWTKVFNEGNQVQFATFVSTPDGVALGGSFQSTFTIDAETLSATAQFASPALLVHVSGDGKVTRAENHGNSAVVQGIAATNDGGELVSGTFYGELGFGGLSMATASRAWFVTKLDAAGKPVWSKHGLGEGTFGLTRWNNGAALLIRGTWIDLGVGRWQNGNVVARVEADGSIPWARQLGLEASGYRGTMGVESQSYLVTTLARHSGSEGATTGNPDLIQRSVVALDDQGRLAGSMPLDSFYTNAQPTTTSLSAAQNGEVVIGTIRQEYISNAGNWLTTNSVRRVSLPYSGPE